jgi:LemA protein
MSIVLIAIVAGIVLLLVMMYNGLAQLLVRADSAWSDIDVQLKRRHDLIPNLVETVKGYATHEKGTFENIARYRSAAMSATSVDEKAQAEGQLTQALRGLLAVAENYPQLRASEQFTSLQSNLTDTENAIQNSRRYYNAVVRDLNTKIATFPSNIIANMFSFQPRQFFQTDTAEDRATPVVKF